MKARIVGVLTLAAVVVILAAAVELPGLAVLRIFYPFSKDHYVIAPIITVGGAICLYVFRNFVVGMSQITKEVGEHVLQYITLWRETKR